MATCHWILLACLTLNICQRAVALERNDCSSSPEVRCDFVCDCQDCSDEEDCGYQGQDFLCDFEHEGKCGWTEKSDEGGYMWQRQQRGNTLPDSGPSSDFTTGTSTGWFMAVTAVTSNTPRTAVLVSPTIKHSSPTCRLRLRYFLWDSGHIGLGDTPLWGSVLQIDGEEAVVWRPESTSVRGWREAIIYLGRISGPFHIQLHSRRSEGKQGDVSIDQMEFLDCALPVPPESGTCGPGFMTCKREGCVEDYKVCDGTDDCGDGTDEENCVYTQQNISCNFEDGLCGWDLRTLSSLKWTRTSQRNISLSEPLKGPGRDHTTNTVAGHFLYVTDDKKSDWSSFHSPPMAPTNETHPCRMVMYTHQFGRVSGGLSVLVAEQHIYPVWERGGALGDLWVKAEVEFVVNSTFQILFVPAIRDQAYGGIAIDDIVLSPECRLSNESMPDPEYPRPPPHPCTNDDLKICDFKEDCSAGEDEAQCGDFAYEMGSSGWTDASLGSQAWELKLEYNDTIKDEFLTVIGAPGQQLSEAQTRTPLLGPSGPACTLQFSYSLSGSNPHIGDLAVYVVDSVLGTHPVLWEFSGRTNETAGTWVKEEVYVGARDHRFQLEFRAHAKEISPSSQIAVKDVHFIDCSTLFVPSGDISCNFEVNLCGWNQDQTDNYDWTLHSGMDHTVHDGKSLVVDMWDPSLRGLSGRLLSVRQNSNSEHCLSFFYKLYGPDTGALSVKLLFADGSEELLWTRSGAHGNVWHEGHCSVPPQLSAFQLVFEATRSGFDGQLALDDVAFVAEPCSLPTMCSFESQTCGYTSSGRARWVHQSWALAQTGPKIDHSLETENGFYMLAHSSVDVLPQGSVTTLTSPVRRGVSHTECVHFWYHTGGEKPGTLNVYVKPTHGNRIQLFSSSIRQGHAWRHGQGNVNWNGDWQLQFEVKGEGDPSSFIAVDDITYSTHSCPTADSVCDFERGLCGWSNTQNSSVDWLDWDLTSVKAEMFYCTPPYDHTLFTDEGHFLVLPNSQRDTANQNAWLLSPHLPPTKGTCLKFWVYQPTIYDTKLTVWRLFENTRNELLTLHEGGGDWKRFSVNITSETEYQIVLEGFKGEKGVLALDDIQYTVGVNCAGQKTDQTSSSSNNTGTIVAVVVVIVLIVLLAAFLVFYLKTKHKTNALIQESNGSRVNPTGFSNDMYESANA
ncbi:apical endosomal glycoprotein [Labeo rohita]|uniref:apical endosomal glycoprotein n=1 Tax=Labeo rohita TaxID=84645 RepID=UPI0021E21AF3|nr:apical endosomal glycoprotein [Labeo rohita]